MHNIICLLRCTSRRYAEKFCNEGSIKFNTPYSWVEYENKNGKGRGDLLEGVFASMHTDCYKYDTTSLALINNLRNNIKGKTIKDRTYFRSDDIIYLPCYCLFGINSKDFSKVETDEKGLKHHMITIGNEYFRDFSDSKTKASLKEEQPVLIMITKPNKFFNRLINHLTELGVKKEEILISPVEYINKNEDFYLSKSMPYELFLKDKSFNHQREIRVVINTKNEDIKRYLSETPINIGSLNDIARIEEYYYDIDMIIEKQGNSLIYNLSEPKLSAIADGSIEYLMGLLLQIVHSNLGEWGIKTEEDRENITKYIERVLSEKHNISVSWRGKYIEGFISHGIDLNL